MLMRGFNKAGKQRMAVAWGRGKLRVELAGHKPRMVRDLNNLNQLIITRATC